MQSPSLSAALLVLWRVREYARNTSPFSTPPNALVMPAGQYTFMDYIKVGLPLQIIMGIVMVFVLPMFFPF